LGRAQAAAAAEAAQAAALADAQRLVDAAKATLPVPFRPDGPPLGYIFDDPPGAQHLLTVHVVWIDNCIKLPSASSLFLVFVNNCALCLHQSQHG
jgi:hypothetical protein